MIKGVSVKQFLSADINEKSHFFSNKFSVLVSFQLQQEHES